VRQRGITVHSLPTAPMAYKLVAREDEAGRMIGVAKQSQDKQSVGGRKYALRRRNALGVVEAEVLGIGERPVGDGDDRDLMVSLVSDGEVVGREHAGLEAARARHEASMAELPRSAHQLSEGQPAVETVFLTETP